jgi:hypothetical protein
MNEKKVMHQKAGNVTHADIGCEQEGRETNSPAALECAVVVELAFDTVEFIADHRRASEKQLRFALVTVGASGVGRTFTAFAMVTAAGLTPNLPPVWPVRPGIDAGLMRSSARPPALPMPPNRRGPGALIDRSGMPIVDFAMVICPSIINLVQFALLESPHTWS